MKFFSNGQGQPEQTHTHTAELEKKKFYHKLLGHSRIYIYARQACFVSRLAAFAYVHICQDSNARATGIKYADTDGRTDGRTGRIKSVGNHIRRGSSSELNLGGTHTPDRITVLCGEDMRRTEEENLFLNKKRI
jgi:hypothetical protein